MRLEFEERNLVIIRYIGDESVNSIEFGNMQFDSNNGFIIIELRKSIGGDPFTGKVCGGRVNNSFPEGAPFGVKEASGKWDL